MVKWFACKVMEITANLPVSNDWHGKVNADNDYHPINPRYGFLSGDVFSPDESKRTKQKIVLLNIDKNGTGLCVPIS